MARISLSISLLFALASGICQDAEKIERGLYRVSTGIVLDTFSNEVELLVSENGLPKKFVSSVFTPVCGSDECLPVRIELYWDLGGNYLQFAFKNGDSLTKVDHIPFTPNDYLYLARVLKNDKSRLQEYTLEQLAPQKKKNGEVDGVSGSTIPELEGYYVPGALFTSFTLWHLTNGAIKNSLINYTSENLLTEYPREYFLNEADLGLQKHVLHQLASASSDYYGFLLSVIDTTDNSLTVTCLDLIKKEDTTNEILTPVIVRKYLASTNTLVHEKIVETWTDLQLPEPAQMALVDKLGETSSTLSAEIQILTTQDIWYETVYYRFVERIEATGNMIRKEKIKKLLDSRKEQFSKKFRKYYDKTFQ